MIKPLLLFGLSHSREHKFEHSFQGSLNTFCSYEKGEIEPVLIIFSTLPTIRKNDSGMSILQQSD